jgi:2-amino-4-hydroxy-6-hydroxymethyldihydropteridine diphosphokinase
MYELAVIALGGNLPGSFATVQAALDAAAARLPGAGFEIVRISRWWRSAAWPDSSDPPFLNGVVLARTSLEPAAALAALHGLEADFGRRRGDPNAPRTLDLDLIAHGRTVLAGPPVALPHPRAAERLFVMGPLAEIAPDWRHPVTGETAATLARTAAIGQDAAPL